jgi:hypothetical protein
LTINLEHQQSRHWLQGLNSSRPRRVACGEESKNKKTGALASCIADRAAPDRREGKMNTLKNFFKTNFAATTAFLVTMSGLTFWLATVTYPNMLLAIQANPGNPFRYFEGGARMQSVPGLFLSAGITVFGWICWWFYATSDDQFEDFVNEHTGLCGSIAAILTVVAFFAFCTMVSGMVYGEDVWLPALVVLLITGVPAGWLWATING